MIKFAAAVAFILLVTVCHSAYACMPLLPYELKMRDAVEKRVFVAQSTMGNPQAQELADKLTSFTSNPDLVGVERIDVWFDQKDDSVLVFPLQRLTPDDDLVSCQMFGMQVRDFKKALVGKGQDA
ncbi:hypothetical protein NKJ88_06170 [Mesorhizobium sp. M0016]|uniref:hypothetical protein n=1 Tax=Mesorhizobium sp. M0016 TaxID=2956843 RepID=UPI00333BF54F